MAKKYVAVSGGADSVATALLLWERGEDFEIGFSDTGAEFNENYWIILRLSELIQKKLNVVSNGSLYQRLNDYNFMLPGPMKRWCTRILKETPQDLFYRENGAEIVYWGIRGDEPARAIPRKPRYGNHVFQYPLAEIGYGKREVKEICKKYDLLNPVYEWRSNISCFCCFFQKKSDWRGLLVHYPSLYQLADQWEKQAYICGKRQGVEEPHGWNERFTLEEFRRAKKAQYDMWPDPEGEPCLICQI